MSTNNVNDFVKGDLITEKHDMKPDIMLRLSPRLKSTIPQATGTRLYYLRRAIEILYLIRNSPFRTEILAHLGYDDEMMFHLDQFDQNYRDGYFAKVFADMTEIPKSTEKPNDDLKPLQNELMDAYTVILIYNALFTRVLDTFKANYNADTKDSALLLSAYKQLFPNKEDMAMLTEAVKHAKEKKGGNK